METIKRPFLALMGASLALHALVLSALPKSVMMRVVTSPVEMALYVPTPVVVAPKVEEARRVTTAKRSFAKAAAAVPAKTTTGPSEESVSEVGAIPVIASVSPFGPAAKKVEPPGNGFPSLEGGGGGASSEPVLLGEIKVPYPTEAHRNDIEGTVRMFVTIDANGVVTSVKVLGGPGYGLNEAARDAMLRFRFKPAMKNGETVGTSFTYAYTFSLE